MKTYKYPSRDSWKALAQRPEPENERLEAAVSEILAEVKARGDEALIEFGKRFEKTPTQALRVKVEEAIAGYRMDSSLLDAIDLAYSNIEAYHIATAPRGASIEATAGVICESRYLAMDKVGLYIPGGSAPLFSTLLMLGIPARLARCPRVVVCTPPDSDGKLNPVIGSICRMLGIDEVYLTGGAQAVAAMAYGTETIPKVDKIFGPGNSYVTTAKQLVQRDGLAIDMPAGPSEVLVLADASCRADFVAADLLSQAEHGPDSQVMLVLHEAEGDATAFASEVEAQLELQLARLDRAQTARKALDNSRTMIFKTPEEAMDFSNVYAPEHLIIASGKFEKLAGLVRNAGSVFLGPWSCESAGDYASGTNHTLPTAGYARSYSGVSVESFMKKISFQTLSPEGILGIGKAVETMARFEGLDAHENAMTLRLNQIGNV